MASSPTRRAIASASSLRRLRRGQSGLALSSTGVGLASRPVEREHALCVQPFAVGMLGRELIQLGSQVAVPAGAQVCLDPKLERDQSALLQSPDLALREFRVRQFGQRRTAPELQRGAQDRCGLLRSIRLERV
jgi:hypothetical protein